MKYPNLCRSCRVTSDDVCRRSDLRDILCDDCHEHFSNAA